MTLTRRRLLWTWGFAAAFVGLTLADRAIVLAVARPETRDTAWMWAIKQVGDVRFWLVAALIAWVWQRDWRWPAGLVGSAALGGGLAELGKLVCGRERPVRDFVLQNDAHYVWKDGPLGPLLAGFWDSSNLGLPSSHAGVAFGGAAMLGLLDPALRWPALLLATACAASRVLAGAHYPTDVLLGAALGAAGAALIARLARGRTPAPPDTIAP